MLNNFSGLKYIKNDELLDNKQTSFINGKLITTNLKNCSNCLAATNKMVLGGRYLSSIVNKNGSKYVKDLAPSPHSLEGTAGQGINKASSVYVGRRNYRNKSVVDNR
jgi:hypothetical protein